MTLALGFGARPPRRRSPRRAPRSSAASPRAARAYDRGWHDYLDGAQAAPGQRARLRARLLGLGDGARGERGQDCTAAPRSRRRACPGPGACSTIDEPSAAYHLVWPRDLYQVATRADRRSATAPAAERALDFPSSASRRPTARSRRTRRVDGAENWTNLQMDEVALPIVLAWQLRRFDAATYNEHVKQAADFIAANGPYTPQERWENQSGCSPGTIAAEIAGLICAADIARRNGDVASAQRWETVADDWQSQVDAWTATLQRPLQPEALLPAPDQGPRRPERGHDLLDRRRRAVGCRPALGRRPELPRARAARRQAARRPDDAATR